MKMDLHTYQANTRFLTHASEGKKIGDLLRKTNLNVVWCVEKEIEKNEEKEVKKNMVINKGTKTEKKCMYY